MKSFNLTRYSVTHPIGIFMIVLFFVVLGLYSYWRIGVELYPNINVPYVIVSVRYDGADAESVEQQITKPLEDALSSVSNVKHITSKSRTGRSDVTLELNFDADADAAAIDASEKVDRIRRKLPDDADDPIVEKRDMDAAPIIWRYCRPIRWMRCIPWRIILSRMISRRRTVYRMWSCTGGEARRSR